MPMNLNKPLGQLYLTDRIKYYVVKTGYGDLLSVQNSFLLIWWFQSHLLSFLRKFEEKKTHAIATCLLSQGASWDFKLENKVQAP